MSNVIELSQHRRTAPEESLDALENYLSRLKQGAEIISLEHLGTERKHGGVLHRYGFVTAAGYAYNGNVTVPDEISSDIPVIGKAAWQASPRGHHEHTFLKLMEDGLPGILVGNEGSYRPRYLPRPKTPMTLAGTSAAALNFSQEVVKQFHYLMNPTLRTAIGESKGGMEGMGSLWLAPFFDQNILMADYTAPCIPRKIQLADLAEFSEQLKSEPVALAQLLGKITLGLLLHYPATVDLHPYALAHQAVKGFSVFSGEAGDLGRMVDTQQILHMTTFSGDVASMEAVWSEIFTPESHPNVRITPLKGNHLTIADPETQAYVRARQRAFREVYETAEGDMSLITGDEVFDLAHAYVKEYLRPSPNGVINKLARLVFGHTSNQLEEAA